MTPRETLRAMDAEIWRAEREARRDITLAWHIAALNRTRRLPSLRQLLHKGETKTLTGEERERRRREHEEMMASIRTSGLNVRGRNGR